MQDGKQNGRCNAIVGYVTAHPGCKAGEILAAVGAGDRYRSINYAQQRGVIWPAGPMQFRAYYPTQEAAAEADPILRAEHEQRIKDNLRERRRRRNVKKWARIKASRPDTAAPARKRAPMKPIHAPAESVKVMVFAPGCKITIAPPFVDRRRELDIGPGWVGAITSDWFERRQVRP
jgi:hypothetical protein